MKIFPDIQHDKAMHSINGLAIYIIVVALCLMQGGYLFDPGIAPVLGLSAAIAAGIAKELNDAWANWQANRAGLPEPHSVEFADFAATALGGAAGFACRYI
jgi:hypothetical protein